MANTIKHKRSSTAGLVPGTGSLDQGELAINLADGKIYTKNSSNTIINLGTTTISGTSITPNSGNFINSLQLNGTGVMISSGATSSYIPKFNSSNTLVNSAIYENATGIGISTTTPSGQLHVIGTGVFSSRLGIGTSTPACALHVVGSGIVSSGLDVSGSLNVNGSGVGFYDTSIFPLGTVSGTNSINCGQDRQIQTLTLNGSATTFTKGSNWPSASNISRDVTVNIYASGNTSVTWTLVTDWYRQPDSPLPSGNHVLLLRGIGTGIIQGHYIGSKTN
jgi:hypothetical protein